MNSERDAQLQFERDVLRIARARWPSAAYGGAAMIDDRERDGVFETEDCLHLLECTVSRKQEKAKQDISKLVNLAQKLQKQTAKVVRCWFVTRDEPTADQRSAGEKHRPQLSVLGFTQFQASLIDAAAYLDTRENYAFGSVRDPVTGAQKTKLDYVPLNLVAEEPPHRWSPADVAAALILGRRVLLLGDYGAGKSMTLRQIHRLLAIRHRKGESVCFPVYINLRDHYGQSDPAEILERHGRVIGFKDPSHLVRAWRAGWVHLLLDGFDEVTTLTLAGPWRKLRDSRYRAMELVRGLVAAQPQEAGLVLAGRGHFFDSAAERTGALGVGASVLTLSLAEFDDAEIRRYLSAVGISGAVPDWLPSRPLLISYLAASGLLRDVVGEWGARLSPAEGWHLLLDRIAQREATIEAGIDGPTVRRVLERLATKARASAGGLGPLSADSIVAAFREVSGYAPDDRGLLLLQRLPGLGVEQGESESRRFVDLDLAEACRAGDVVGFVQNPYDPVGTPVALECEAGSLGVGVAALRLAELPGNAGLLRAAVDRAVAVGSNYLLADLVLAALNAGIEVTSTVYVRDVFLGEISLSASATTVSRVHFQDCYFASVGVDADVDPGALPRFVRCFIAVLEGRVSERDLPAGVFSECDIEAFESEASTTDAILDLPIPIGVRVLVTILQKLFERRGRGRRENALYRGLDHRARQFVPDVLQLIRAHGMASPCRMGTETVWLPDRTAHPRAGRIVASPSSQDEPLVVAAAELA